MVNDVKSFSITKVAMAIVFAAIGVRLFSLGFFPLMDTTEARYGEMARIMFETGNWVTPMFDYDVPFWGKPPLFTWLSAAGITVFGLNEFAVRIPHLIVGTFILAIVGILAFNVNKTQSLSARKQDAWLAAAILSTTATFLVVSGAVMTDTALTFGITLSMISFWFNLKERSKLWGNLFFVGLTIGMLAKGPLALVLIGMSLFLWALFNKQWRSLFCSLPWKTGIPLFLATTLPWYVIAEMSSPGFLNYFIIGEHVKRFLVSGWQGDLYGTAHKEIKGTIWLFAIASALPWTPIFVYQWVKGFTAKQSGVDGNQLTESNCISYTSFLWCWLLAPLLLFTFSGNILSSYVMPALPPFALLLVAYHHSNPLSQKVYKAGFFTPVLIFIIAFLLRAEFTGKQSEKGLMQDWKQQATNSELLYITKRPFSAQFYSEGKAVKIEDSLEVAVQKIKQETFFVTGKDSETRLLVKSLSNCDVTAEAKKRMLIKCSVN